MSWKQFINNLRDGAKFLWDLALTNSLWLVGLGLMLSSSGIDGAYMSKWMEPRLAWSGYVLNTVSDIGGMVLMYWYGRILQTRKNAPGAAVKLLMARFLLLSEVVAIAYSWFFSWRWLRRIMYGIEDMPLVSNWAPDLAPIEIEIVAFVSAGFIPLMLAFIGLAQSILAGRIETESDTNTARKMRAEIVHWRAIAANLDGQSAQVDAAFVANALKDAGYTLPGKRTIQSWAKLTREGLL